MKAPRFIRDLNTTISGAKRQLLIISGIAIFLSIVYCGICYFIIASSLTPVKIDYESTPEESGLHAERIHFKSAWDGVPLVGWLLPSWGDRAIVIVHGLDGNGWSGAEPTIARAYVDAGFHVLVFDLRGRGKSGGDRIGLGWYERGDVRAAVDILLGRGIEPGKIGLHGTSYGAATSLLAANKIPEVGAVISDSAFADMRDLMDGEIEKRTGVPEEVSRWLLRPGIALLARTLYSLNFDEITPEKGVGKIHPRHILFIHGENDTAIPVEHLHRLRGAANKDTSDVWVLPGLGHTEGVWIWNTPREVSPLREEYLKRVVTFFEEKLQTITKY